MWHINETIVTYALLLQPNLLSFLSSCLSVRAQASIRWEEVYPPNTPAPGVTMK